jgi:hypothetical protein
MEKLTTGAKCSMWLALLIRGEQLWLLKSLVLEVLERRFRCNVTNHETSCAISQSNAIDMGYINAEKERGTDSENFGTRITGFGVVVEKIW